MRRFRHEMLISLALVGMTLAAFGSVRTFGFVNYDDGDYAADNPHVRTGLTRDNIRWAFTTTHASNWHPLTWLSLQLDASLFGLKPQAFHLSNLAFHLVNTLLLFGVLRALTGAVWRSALVAALFAVHPLHVESVVWIAERKDVLSTLFWLLTLAAYAGYAARPGAWRYLAVMVFFTLGLMAKPMLVTLPCVLLLLDVWPLRRLGLIDVCASEATHREGKAPAEPLLPARPEPRPPECSARSAASKSRLFLVIEKLPLFALSAASCVVTVLAQQRAVKSLHALPVSDRFLNAAAAYAEYLGQMLYPRNLCVLYPHPGSALPLWRALLALAVLTLISVVAVRAARRRPYLLVGWLWYLGTLVPVIGLVQVGEQAMADRYTYVPLIGIFVVLAWGLPDLLTALRLRPGLMVFPVLLLLLACVVVSREQVQHWSDSIKLWERALEVDPGNATAHNNLGVAKLNDKPDEALGHFQTALQLRGGQDAKALNNVGLILLRQGKLDEAVEYFQRALEVRPDLATAHSNLGVARGRQGRLDAAVESQREAVRLQPENGEFRSLLAAALKQRGNAGKAANCDALKPAP